MLDRVGAAQHSVTHVECAYWPVTPERYHARSLRKRFPDGKPLTRCGLTIQRQWPFRHAKKMSGGYRFSVLRGLVHYCDIQYR